MNRLAITCLLVLGSLASPARAAVSFLPGSEESGLLGCYGPPAQELYPSDPNLLVAGCTNFPPVVGSFVLRADPNLPLLAAPGFPLFDLPADLNGSLPDPLSTPYIDGIWMESATLGWMTTSNYETIVPFNPVTGLAYDVSYAGIVRKSIPSDATITGSFTRSDSTPIASFVTDLTSGAVRVGDRLLVTSGNFDSFSPQVNDPGTVLLFDIDDANSPWLVTPATPAYILTSDPNPTEITLLPSGLVAVTNTGLIDFSVPPDYKPGAVGPGSIDIIDPVAATVLASIPLGFSSPSYKTLAVDATGSVAVVGSATLRQLFAIDLRDLDQLPDPGIDPSLQRPSCDGLGSGLAGGVPCLPERVIRGVSNPILIDPAPTLSGTDDFVPQSRFGASGDFVVSIVFNDGLVSVVAFDDRNLATAHALQASRFGPSTSLVATAPLEQASSEHGPGTLTLRDSSTGGVDGTDVVWMTLGPDGTVGRATLSGSLAVPTGDADLDTVEDALDNCPLEANLSQLNQGGFGPGGADAIGDACQCGDVDDDGEVLDADLAALRDWLAGLTASLPAQSKCNVVGDAGPSDCDLLDRVVLERALGRLSPKAGHVCAPFLS